VLSLSKQSKQSKHKIWSKRKPFSHQHFSGHKARIQEPMNKWITIPAALLLLVCAEASAQKGKKPAAQPAAPAMKTSNDSISYAIGLNLGKSLKENGVTVAPAMVSVGIADGLAGSPKLTDEQIQQVLIVLQQELAARQAAQGGGNQAGTAQGGGGGAQTIPQQQGQNQVPPEQLAAQN
jgi:hypothetical protein